MPRGVTAIRREHVEAFVAEQFERWTASTAATRYRSLQELFRFLVIDTLPARLREDASRARWPQSRRWDRAALAAARPDLLVALGCRDRRRHSGPARRRGARVPR